MFGGLPRTKVGPGGHAYRKTGPGGQAVFAVSYYALPPEFTGIFEDPDRVVKNWHMFFCVACGLWGGLIIGIATEYFTSNRYQPVQVWHPPLHGPPSRSILLLQF